MSAVTLTPVGGYGVRHKYATMGRMTQQTSAAAVLDERAATTAYRAARDQLVSLSGDHERAAAEFVWPDVGPTFNWAHDWFDAVARGND